MQLWYLSEFDSHATTKIKIMYEVLEHWKQYKLEKNKQKDKLIEELMTKNLSYKEFDKELNKILKNQKLCQEK